MSFAEAPYERATRDLMTAALELAWTAAVLEAPGLSPIGRADMANAIGRDVQPQMVRRVLQPTGKPDAVHAFSRQIGMGHRQIQLAIPEAIVAAAKEVIATAKSAGKK